MDLYTFEYDVLYTQVDELRPRAGRAAGRGDERDALGMAGELLTRLSTLAGSGLFIRCSTSSMPRMLSAWNPAPSSAKAAVLPLIAIGAELLRTP
jgi:hypothetical protein